ncbi:MAG TPA: hypothetical protein VF753_00740 [Terriglobales bacterium]
MIRIASFPHMRVLCWSDGFLYASRGYELSRAKLGEQASRVVWQPVAAWPAEYVRKCTSRFPLTSRLVRDGFHALAVLSSGNIVGAVPGHIVTLSPSESRFRSTHKILRGTRPLHITKTPNDQIVWGEYFDNPARSEVHIYASTDSGEHWEVAYTFPRQSIRHIHNIVYDRWGNCFWVLTGDIGSECRILRASLDFTNWDTVLSGSQQTRCAAMVPTRDAVYFSSDTPLETNFIYRFDRKGNLDKVAALPGSSIYGCRVGDCLFFSAMFEPSHVNHNRKVALFGSADRRQWHELQQWTKDAWPTNLFQYGNAFLPDGENESDVLALTTLAVKRAETSIWNVS